MSTSGLETGVSGARDDQGAANTWVYSGSLESDILSLSILTHHTHTKEEATNHRNMSIWKPLDLGKVPECN